MCWPSIRAPRPRARSCFAADISIAATAQAEFPQHFPASGWVEHEPEDIWTSTIATCREALKKAGLDARDIAAIGITNQRETTVVWDRVTGQAVHRAIVWQDRRTADICARLKSEGHEPAISAKTGLIIDPYFSGTKVAWILDHDPRRAGARRARRTDVRHRRLLPAVAADRRQGACDRRHQRLAHAAVQHPHWRVGRRVAEDPARAALDAPRGEGFVRRFRRKPARMVRRRDRDPRHRRRPAGRHHRPGLLFAGDDQVDLRHRLLCPAQHRHHARQLEEQAPDHHRLSARGSAHLRARRFDLRRRLRGAVVARRHRPHQERRRDRPARRPVRTRRSRSIWSRPLSAWARRTGIRGCAGRCSG